MSQLSKDEISKVFEAIFAPNTSDPLLQGMLKYQQRQPSVNNNKPRNAFAELKEYQKRGEGGQELLRDHMHNSEMINEVKQAMSMDRALYKNNQKRGNVEVFEGYIMEAKDRLSPQLFGFTEEWVIANFTRVGDGKKRKICGKVPYVQKYVVYRMQLQETYYAKKCEWQWRIESVETHPPFHDQKMFGHFVSAFAKQFIPNKTELDTFNKKFVKAVKQEFAKPNTALKDWFYSWEHFEPIRCKLFAPDRCDKNPDFHLYDCINSSYDAEAIFADNPWWMNLDEQIKSKWENQLKTPESAFKMCFRQTMPSSLRYQCHRKEEDRVEDLPFLDKVFEKTTTSEKKSTINSSTYDYLDLPQEAEEENEQEVDIVERLFGIHSDEPNYYPEPHKPREKLQDLMLELNRIVVLQEMQHSMNRKDVIQDEHGHLVSQEATNKRVKKIKFIPELDYDGFKRLAAKNRWIEPGKYVKPSYNIHYYPIVVPELTNYLNAIATYQWYCRVINETKECAIRLDKIPTHLHKGIELLVQYNVLAEFAETYPMSEAKKSTATTTTTVNLSDSCIQVDGTGTKHVHVQQPPNTQSRFIIHSFWLECKKYLIRRLKQMCGKPAPDNKYDRNATTNGWNEDQKNVVEMVRDHSISIISGLAGTGKCLGENTPLIMYDGSVKMVQDVTIGDVLMGDDNLPRFVKSTVCGYDTMYKINQLGQESYTVNSNHILSLKLAVPFWESNTPEDATLVWFENFQLKSSRFSVACNVVEDAINTREAFKNELLSQRKCNVYGDICDIPLQEYLAKPNQWKESFKGFKSGSITCWPEQKVEVDPYTFGYSLVLGHNDDDKCIPHIYKINSKANRLQLLAGILDADGDRDYYNVFFKVSQKSKTLFDDVVFLCRSLGFMVSIDNTLSTCTIYGDRINEIPRRILKMQTETCIYHENPLFYPIEVEKLETDVYYGFEIDGNKRFLLGDFTVTHNTEALKRLDDTFDGMVVLSFTGKAVDEASSRVENAEFSTIHSWMLRHDVKERDHNVLVLDELSMASERLFMQLISLVKWDRLVLVGDPNQIPSFGDFKGVILREFLKVFPTYTLRRNYRQEQNPNNLILPNAMRVLQNEFPLKQDRDTFRIRTADRVIDAIREHKSSNFQNITFITGTNEHANTLNHLCVSLRHELTHPEWKDESFKTLTRNTFSVGDRLLFYTRVNRTKQSRLLTKTELNSKNSTQVIEMKNARTPEYLDELWNAEHYRDTNQTSRKSRYLFRNGQQDTIVGIFRIKNWAALLKYYDDEKKSFDQLHKSSKRKKTQTEKQKHNKSSKQHTKEENDENNDNDNRDETDDTLVTSVKGQIAPQFDVRKLPLPANSVESGLTMITRGRYDPELQRKLNENQITTKKERENRIYSSDHTVILQLESGRWCRLSDEFCHGYAMTVNKMQGGSNKCIALYMPGYKENDFLQRIFGRNHLYTAITRAISQFTFYGQGPQELKAMIDNVKNDVCCLSEIYLQLWELNEEAEEDSSDEMEN